MTIEAPPDIGEKTDTSSNLPWAECIVEECNQENCRRVESWIFRKEHAKDYQGFLNLRNVKPQGFLPYHGSKDISTSVNCRERGVI
eukprot:TRINITY_DN119148_c0_g1_i1.p1 TRINITY_DN119148_c0_g1~~TRINITY_DN119148_c0_g1_i1.p1  ORF type:complete len:101 (-),score=8.62 TRINITY_DN119148_c0_g1_i1:36-293(-)